MAVVKTAKYAAIQGSRLSDEQAEIYGLYLESLQEQAGALTPELLVQVANDPKNPLHAYFEWDEQRAAHRYRVEQARHLLRSIRVVDRPLSSGDDWQHSQTRAFHNVSVTTQDDKFIRVYLSTDKILESEQLTTQVLTRMKKDLLTFTKRYESFLKTVEDFQLLSAAIDGLLLDDDVWERNGASGHA